MLTQAEKECFSSFLRAFETDPERAEPIGRLVATWLLSGIHAKEAGVWMNSPLSESVNGVMTGNIPVSYQTVESPEILVRHAVRFIRWTIKIEDERLCPDGLRIVRKLMQREPTSFRQLTTHKLEQLASELEDLFSPSTINWKQTKTAVELEQLATRLATKKSEYLHELANLEQLEYARMQAGELIAGSLQLPEVGTHLHRFSAQAREEKSQGRGGASLLLYRYKYRAAYYFAEYLQDLVSSHELGEKLPAFRDLQTKVDAFKGEVRLNHIEFFEFQHQLLDRIFGRHVAQEPAH
jgi:hypothetical protein